jgi:ElaB/YqjD/DUF883 family membrane-anchored ribosome-binding protein
MANDNFNRQSGNTSGGIATYGTPPVREDLNEGSSYGSDGKSGEGMQQKAMEKAQEMQGIAAEKAGEVGSKLHDTADMGVNRAAEGLDQASMQLRERASEMGGVQEKLGLRVADSLDKTSGYLREHEAQEIWTDVEKFVREHPMQAAVTAAVAGYVVAKVMK